jgi:hypothetical protein
MLRVRYVLLMGMVAPWMALTASCQCEPSGTTPAGSAAASVSAPPPVASAAPGDGDDVKPVYPQTNDPPLPEAQRYCDLIYEVAEKKRKECCPTTPFTSFRPTAECVRTLSYAIRSKAIALPPAALDACAAEVATEAERCDWGGAVPAACTGILAGQVAESQLCRSSLECQEGLHCEGLGTTTAGKCVAARAIGQRCGGSSDTLGAFTRQDADRKHPVCDGGYCEKRLCVATVAVGQPCRSSVQCGDGRRCHDGKCTDAAAPRAGEPCAHGSCELGAVCSSGTCVATKRLTEPCASDEECRSRFCDKGSCALSCAIIRPQTASSSAPSAQPWKPGPKP